MTSGPQNIRAGCIADDHVPCLSAVRRGRISPSVMAFGWPSGSSVGEMRFRWIAEELNRGREALFRYEWYRPWRSYDAVVFLKSMGPEALALADRLKARGVALLFDANVDFFTPAAGTFYYDGMSPSEEQRQCALAMAEKCRLIIADSEHIAEACPSLPAKVAWIPDNVDMSLVPAECHMGPQGEGKLNVFWCGEAVKMFDLLAAEQPLREFSRFIKLTIVTSDLRDLDKLYPAVRERLDRLMAFLQPDIRRFAGIADLMSLYARGGIFISPRFLDNTYNLGHTEWKITLPMACGQIVFCSPLRSYLTVSKRSEGKGVRVCGSEDEWRAAFGSVLEQKLDMAGEGMAAQRVVKDYYATSVVAAQVREAVCRTVREARA